MRMDILCHAKKITEVIEGLEIDVFGKDRYKRCED